MSVSTIVQSINDVGDKMNHNTKNIETLAVISQDVEEKINTTSDAISESNRVAQNSKDDSIKMSKDIQVIIDDISKIESLSIANGTSAQSIEEDLERLVVVAKSLQSSIEEFKS